MDPRSDPAPELAGQLARMEGILGLLVSQVERMQDELAKSTQGQHRLKATKDRMGRRDYEESKLHVEEETHRVKKGDEELQLPDRPPTHR